MKGQLWLICFNTNDFRDQHVKRTEVSLWSWTFSTHLFWIQQQLGWFHFRPTSTHPLPMLAKTTKPTASKRGSCKPYKTATSFFFCALMMSIKAIFLSEVTRHVESWSCDKTANLNSYFPFWGVGTAAWPSQGGGKKESHTGEVKIQTAGWQELADLWQIHSSGVCFKNQSLLCEQTAFYQTGSETNWINKGKRKKMNFGF